MKVTMQQCRVIPQSGGRGGRERGSKEIEPLYEGITEAVIVPEGEDVDVVRCNGLTMHWLSRDGDIPAYNGVSVWFRTKIETAFAYKYLTPDLSFVRGGYDIGTASIHRDRPLVVFPWGNKSIEIRAPLPEVVTVFRLDDIPPPPSWGEILKELFF